MLESSLYAFHLDSQLIYAMFLCGYLSFQISLSAAEVFQLALVLSNLPLLVFELFFKRLHFGPKAVIAVDDPIDLREYG